MRACGCGWVGGCVCVCVFVCVCVHVSHAVQHTMSLLPSCSPTFIVQCPAIKCSVDCCATGGVSTSAYCSAVCTRCAERLEPKYGVDVRGAGVDVGGGGVCLHGQAVVARVGRHQRPVVPVPPPLYAAQNRFQTLGVPRVAGESAGAEAEFIYEGKLLLPQLLRLL